MCAGRWPPPLFKYSGQRSECDLFVLPDADHSEVTKLRALVLDCASLTVLEFVSLTDLKFGSLTDLKFEAKRACTNALVLQP